MQKLNILWIIFLSIPSFSDLSDKPKILNSSPIPNQGTSCLGCVDSAEVTKNELVQLCVNTLCPDKNLSMSKNENDVFTNLGKVYQMYHKEIAPLTSEIRRLEIEYRKNFNIEAKSWSENPKNLVNPEESRLLNAVASLSMVRYFSYKQMSPDKYIVDREKSRSVFYFLNDQEFEAFSKIADEIGAVYIVPELFLKKRYGVELVGQNKFVSFIASEVIDKTFNDLLNNPKNTILLKSKAFRSLLNPTEFKERLFSKTNLSPFALEELERLLRSTEYLKILTDDSKLSPLIDSPLLDIPSLAKKIHYSKYIQQFEIYPSALLNASRSADSICEAEFIRANTLLPTALEVKKAKTRIDNLKKEYLLGVKKHLSKASFSELEKKMQAWQPVLSESKEEYVKNMKEALRIEIKRAKSSNTDLTYFVNSPHKDFYFSTQMIQSVFNNFDKQLKIENEWRANNVCLMNHFEYLPDAASRHTGKFVFGPAVVRHSPRLDGIVLHELSHLLDGVLSANKLSPETDSWFNKVKSCLVSNHNYSKNDQNSSRSMTDSKAQPPVGEQFLSEDWADLLSSVALPKQENYACFFIKKEGDSGVYREDSFVNLRPGAKHSADLFRLLHLQQLKKGSLPDECQQAVQAQGYKADFKNCLVQDQNPPGVK